MVDHVISCQHSAATNYFKIDQAMDSDQPLVSVVTILMKLDSLLCEHLECMFDLCFTMAKEGNPFSKYTAL